MVVIVVKMRNRCTYAHLKGTWGSADRSSFILSLSANRVEWSAPALAALHPEQEAHFP